MNQIHDRIIHNIYIYKTENELTKINKERNVPYMM